MCIVDRYVLRLFAAVFLVCFISLAGLFVVIDAFGNLDEFINHAGENGSLLRILGDYYGARIVWFFDRMTGSLCLTASVFTLCWLIRQNELTALMAAGIPKARVVAPLFGAVAIISLMAAANRELLIPRLREKLSHNAQNLGGHQKQPMRPQWDYETDINITGKQIVAATEKIIQPRFNLPPNLAQWGKRIAADRGQFQPESAQHGAGYLLSGVSEPGNISGLESLAVDEKRVVLTPREHDWLQPDQCFVVSKVAFQDLLADDSWREFCSTAELIRRVQLPSGSFGARERVTIHSRLLRPMLDCTLLLLGLPLVLARDKGNIFVAAGMCTGISAAFMLVILTCQALGTYTFISPALAAWAPLLLFLPLAISLSDPLRG